jgi:hypothetical protein
LRGAHPKFNLQHGRDNFFQPGKRVVPCNVQKRLQLLPNRPRGHVVLVPANQSY